LKNVFVLTTSRPTFAAFATVSANILLLAQLSLDCLKRWRGQNGPSAALRAAPAYRLVYATAA